MSTPEALAELLLACGRRDERAFARLYESASPKLFAVALRILRRRDWAEDVIQESFVNIWNHAGSYSRGKSAPMTWMTSIVRNRALDWMRRPRLETAELDEGVIERWADEGPGPLALLVQSSEAAMLGRCMERLEGQQAKVIAVAFFQGLTHSEVAAQLDAPLGSVKTWIRRGLEKLRNCLGALEAGPN